MAKKKATTETKLNRIMAVLYNVVADVASSKKTPEVLAVIEKDLALAIAVFRSDYDDDMEIAKLWIEIEAKILVDRAVFNGYIQTSFQPENEVKPDGKPAGKNNTK